MTQTAAAPAPAPRSAPAPAHAAQRPAWPAAVARPARKAQLPTPTLLRLVGVLTVVAALASGFFGWLAGDRQANALGAASTSTDRLLATQQVRNDMVAADALATNGFLVGGLEPTQSREQYARLVDDAAQGLARLSFPSEADTDRVARATAALASYAGLVEQARTANRQGLPVGIAYLDQASAQLRGTLLPELDALVESAADEAAADFDQVADAPLLLLLVLLGLGVLVAVQVWDSRRTHRVFNPALTGASVLVLVTLVAGLGLVNVDRSAKEVRAGPYRDSLAVSQAVSQAYDAQALESLTLIKHGSGSAYEAAFVTATDEARRQLDRVSSGPGSSVGDFSHKFTLWIGLHQAIRDKDDAGDWDGAVAASLSDATLSSRVQFAGFITAATAQADSFRTETTDGLGSARSTANLVSWVAVVAGLAAAALAWRGLARRREEYYR